MAKMAKMGEKRGNRCPDRSRGESVSKLCSFSVYVAIRRSVYMKLCPCVGGAKWPGPDFLFPCCFSFLEVL